VQLRKFLGRAKLATDFMLGRQPLERGVTSFDDDVWIVSYPRSGNTWTRFLIANLVARGETVDWTNIERLVPDIYLNRDPVLRQVPRPRYLKSHEAYRPDYRRVVLIVRDPRDVAVSYFHFLRKSNSLPTDLPIEQFLPRFVEGQTDSYGSWGENVGSWLGARQNTPNFTIVRYEDLLTDAETQLRRVADALSLSASPELIRTAIENSQADRLRKLEDSQRGQHKYLKRSRPEIPFVRAAKADQWQTDLPPATADQIVAAWGDTMRELGYLKERVE